MRAKTIILLALFAFLALAGTFWGLFYHGPEHFLGIDTQQSDNYDFVSGVGPILVTAIGYCGIIGTLLRHLNCHAPGCWGIARFPVAGGMYKVCRHHHPEEHVRDKKLTLQHIHDAHWRLHGGLDRTT